MNRPALLLKYRCTNIIVHREPRVLLGRLRSSKNFLYFMHSNLTMQGMLYYRAPRHVECPAPFRSTFLLLYISPKHLFPPIYEIDSFDLFAANPPEGWHARFEENSTSSSGFWRVSFVGYSELNFRITSTQLSHPFGFWLMSP